MHYIDCHLCQIKGNNYPFGGLVFLLCDDPGQLPPVRALSLWDKNGKAASSNFYRLLSYQQFDIITKLTKIFCLYENDSDAVCYNNFLLCLHDGANTREDWEWIKSRCSKYSMLCKDWEKLNSDKDTVNLFATNKEVGKQNTDCIKKLNEPIVLIQAEHSGQGSKLVSNNASGLESKAYFCKGAKVLLKQNIFQQAGLCNGATGTIVAILYDRNVPPPDLPKCVVVDFGESYSGKPFFHDHAQQGWVPIFPTTYSSNKTNGSCSKNSFILYHVSFTSLLCLDNMEGPRSNSFFEGYCLSWRH